MKNVKYLLLALFLAATVTAGPLQAAEQPQRLKVLTYNIWGIYSAEEIPLRIEALAKKVAQLDPDIFAVEEAFTGKERKLLTEALNDAGYKIQSSHYFRRAYGSGILFISKHKTSKVVWSPYVVNGAWNDIQWLGGKGIAYVEVQTPWGPQDFFITHVIARLSRIFDDNGDVIPHDPDEVDRHIQMYQIDRFIREAKNKEGRSIIAAGDFNISPELPEYNLLLALTGLYNSFDELHPGDNPSTFSSDNVFVESDSSRIDHIMYKNYEGSKGFWLKPVESRVEMTEKITGPSGKQINLSDHYALYTEFEIVTERENASINPAGLGSGEISAKIHSCEGRMHADGYENGVITVTHRNFNRWRAIGLSMYETAYKKQSRHNSLLVPFGAIMTVSSIVEPVKIPVDPKEEKILSKYLCKGSCRRHKK